MMKVQWCPFPGPQTAAAESEADELFYGGAAGGGKSDLLLGLASTQHMQSVIFRRTFKQLTGVGGLIERSKQLLYSTGAGYNSVDHIWRGVPGNRVVGFDGCEYESDVWKYQGKEKDFLGFDEICHFTELQFRTLAGWVRSTAQGQRTRVIAAGNPPTTPEGEWVVQYWAPWLDGSYPNPANPGELRWFAVIDGESIEVEGSKPFTFQGETIYPKSRTFIPASLHDNPVLVASGYESQLQGLPEPLRTQMLFGDFGLSLEDHPWQTIPGNWIIEAQRRHKHKMVDPAPLMTGAGVDVARGGRDDTVIAPLFGTWFAPIVAIKGEDTPNGVAVAMAVLEHVTDDAPVYIDVIGVGSSPYDKLVELEVETIAVNSSESAPKNTKGEDAKDKTGKLRFANLRSYAWWKLRESLDPENGDNIALPDDRRLKADLSAPRYKIVGDRIQVESKKEIIKRLGRSPDVGDAAVYAWLSQSTRQPVNNGYQSVQKRRYASMRRGWA